MASEYAIKQQICEIGKRIYDRGMVANNDGNISVKLNVLSVISKSVYKAIAYKLSYKLFVICNKYFCIIHFFSPFYW